jgi:transposase-like protein
MFAAEIRRKRVDRMRAHTPWSWHLDEVYVKINGETHYLWRAVVRWINNRADSSHQPFRRRERAMLRFLRMKTLQKFASGHGTAHNPFNRERHLTDRQIFKAKPFSRPG